MSDTIYIVWEIYKIPYLKKTKEAIMADKITPSGTVTQYQDRLFISIFGKDNEQSSSFLLSHGFETPNVVSLE